MVNHVILLSLLSYMGILGTMHCWFEWYLTGHSFKKSCQEQNIHVPLPVYQCDIRLGTGTPLLCIIHHFLGPGYPLTWLMYHCCAYRYLLPLTLQCSSGKSPCSHSRDVTIWKIWYLDYSDQIITVNDIITVFLIAVQMSKKHIHWNNFMKSCDFLIILKHLKPQSYQNENFTLKGQTTGTERVYFVIGRQILFTYFVHT